tara:strand:- start:997 stop:1941 length:945 start_codon:yes stop_codon:yes gene_type:complete
MAAKDKFECQECKQEFASERSLHAHFKKHNLTVAEYYTSFYPRYNKLNGEPLPFKTKEDYFASDFSTYQQMIKWCNASDPQEVKEFLLGQLENRVKNKGLEYAPCHLDMRTKKLPPLSFFKKHFGSYTNACNELDIDPLYNKNIPDAFWDKNQEIEDLDIFIDTREQQPLKFNNSTEMKLDFGDYTIGGDHYDYTYVDRKSESDFKGTLGAGYKRFKKELDRCREFNSYLYIVIESDIKQIYKNNHRPHKSNLTYIFYNMRQIIKDYPRRCQFLFTGSREKSVELIPKLLYYGKRLWKVDMQYFLDTREYELNK